MPDQSVEIEDPTLARLYVFRQWTVIEWHNPLKIYMEGRRIGVIGDGDYLCVEVPPGAHLVQMTLERKGHAVDPDGQEYVTVRAGQVLYLKIGLFTGTRWPRFEILAEADGREALEGRDLAPYR